MTQNDVCLKVKKQFLKDAEVECCFESNLESLCPNKKMPVAYDGSRLATSVWDRHPVCVDHSCEVISGIIMKNVSARISA